MNDRLNDTSISRYTSQKCPVCNSFGTLKYGSAVCHGCKGKGFIIIDNNTGLPTENQKDYLKLATILRNTNFEVYGIGNFDITKEELAKVLELLDDKNNQEKLKEYHKILLKKNGL